ncbi:hypothetical protein N7507_002195 [Penicillium longicatenatum]|nr:hypothetical protein N7507_002195 [Penicillium longicatenatum]
MSLYKVLERTAFVPAWGGFGLSLVKDLFSGGKDIVGAMAKRQDADKFSVGPTQPVKKSSRGVLYPEEYLLLG